MINTTIRLDIQADNLDGDELMHLIERAQLFAASIEKDLPHVRASARRFERLSDRR